MSYNGYIKQKENNLSLLDRLKSTSTIKQSSTLSESEMFMDKEMVATDIPAAITAYISYIFGKECFTVTEFAGDTGIKTYVLGFDTKDSANVLQQNAHVGYKWTGVAKVLDGQQGFGVVSLEK